MLEIKNCFGPPPNCSVEVVIDTISLIYCSKELMYQQVLSRFGHFNAIQLNEQVPLKDLIILALKEEDVDSNSNDDDTLKDKIAEVVSFWPFMTDCFT